MERGRETSREKLTNYVRKSFLPRRKQPHNFHLLKKSRISIASYSGDMMKPTESVSDKPENSTFSQVVYIVTTALILLHQNVPLCNAVTRISTYPCQNIYAAPQCRRVGEVAAYRITKINFNVALGMK